MKNVMNNFKTYSAYLGILFMSLSLSSCSDDDDGVIEDPDPVNEATATIDAGDQTLSGNTLIIDNVTVGQDSWVVARNADQQNDPGVVSEFVQLEAGSHDNVEIPLTDAANLEGDADGDDFIVTVHLDDPEEGTQGTFDYDGQSGIDDPITDDQGNEVQAGINARGPNVSIEDDQEVTENNEVTFSNVNTGTNSWVTLYGQGEDGQIDENNVIGRRYVEAGEYENYTVPFDDPDFDYTGQTVYPRLHTDDPADEDFTYTADGTDDLPETYSFDETGNERFVGNTATTDTPGGFRVGNTAGTTN